MPEIVYSGNTEEERRESAINHIRLSDFIDRAVQAGFPATRGDQSMLAYFERFVIEGVIDDKGVFIPLEEVGGPTSPQAPTYIPPPAGAVPATGQVPQGDGSDPTGEPASSPPPAPGKQTRGRIRPVD